MPRRYLVEAGIGKPSMVKSKQPPLPSPDCEGCVMECDACREDIDNAPCVQSMFKDD